MKLATLVQTSAEVGQTSRRLEKTAKLAALLRQLSGDEVAIAVGFLVGWPRQGKIGVGWRRWRRRARCRRRATQRWSFLTSMQSSVGFRRRRGKDRQRGDLN